MGRLTGGPLQPSRGPLMAKPEPKTKIPVRTSVTKPFWPCDQCGYAHDGVPISRAKHQIEVLGTSIYLCNHHFTINAPAILERNYRCIRV